MQAIILAAGLGSRLKPLTEMLPKALTEVCGKPMIVNALEVCADYQVDEVIIVLGYLGEKIREVCGEEFKNMTIRYVYNEIYRETNNNYSLYLTKDMINDDVLLLECDLFYTKLIMKDLVLSEADCSVMVSKYNPDTMDGTVCYADDEKNIYKLVLKKNQYRETSMRDALKTVNIYKFKYDFWHRIFMTELENYIKNHDRKSYYEQALGAVIYYGDSVVKAIEVPEDSWAEVDNLQDLEAAERKFEQI